MNASRIRPAGNPNLFSNTLSESILLSPAALYRRTISQETPRSEDQNQYQNSEDHHVRPADADVLVGHRAYYADQEPAHHRPGEVPNAAQNRRGEREEPLPEAQVEDGGAVEEPEHNPRGSGEDTT